MCILLSFASRGLLSHTMAQNVACILTVCTCARIDLPKIWAPPSTGIYSFMMILQKLSAVQWVWPINAYTYLYCYAIYWHPLIPMRIDVTTCVVSQDVNFRLHATGMLTWCIVSRFVDIITGVDA